MLEADSSVYGVARAGYLIGPLLIILPLIDAAPVLLNAELGDVRWRFGTAGIFSSAIMTPLFGIFVVLAAAAVLGHRRPQRALAWLCLAVAVVLVAAGVIFTLDAMEIHHVAPVDRRSGIGLASVKALAKISLGAVVAAGFGVVTLRATRTEEWMPPMDDSMLVETAE